MPVPIKIIYEPLTIEEKEARALKLLANAMRLFQKIELEPTYCAMILLKYHKPLFEGGKQC